MSTPTTTLTLDGYVVPGNISGYDGWFGTPQRRREDQARSMGKDGDYPSISDYGARYVTFRGIYEATSHTDAHTFVNRMSGLFLTGSGTVTVAGHGPTQWGTAEPVQFLDPIHHTDRVVEWAWSLKFPDPRKYGTVERSTAAGPSKIAQTLSHVGNYFALPRVNVYSANFPNGYTVWGPDGYTRVFRPLASGMVHTLDFATGVGRVQGETAVEMIGKSRLIRIPPNSANISVNVQPYPTSLTETATVRWYWYDTWI